MDIAKRIKALLHGVLERLLSKHAVEIGRQKKRLAAMGRAQFRSHVKFKQRSGAPIHVVLACHAPALWSIFDSVYKTLIEDHRFKVTVVALQYWHSTLPARHCKVEGVAAYLHGRDVSTQTGRKELAGRWRNLETLDPDYHFLRNSHQSSTSSGLSIAFS